jgi:hypothetical protein
MGFIMLFKVLGDGEWKCILYTRLQKRLPNSFIRCLNSAPLKLNSHGFKKVHLHGMHLLVMSKAPIAYSLASFIDLLN